MNTPLSRCMQLQLMISSSAATQSCFNHWTTCGWWDTTSGRAIRTGHGLLSVRTVAGETRRLLWSVGNRGSYLALEVSVIHVFQRWWKLHDHLIWLLLEILKILNITLWYDIFQLHMLWLYPLNWLERSTNIQNAATVQCSDSQRRSARGGRVIKSTSFIIPACA